MRSSSVAGHPLPDSEDALICNALSLLIVQQTADFRCKCVITQIKIELPTIISARRERDHESKRESTQAISFGWDAPRKALLRK